MRNFTPFLLISVAVIICFLFSLGCGPTTDYAKIYNELGLAKVKIEQYEDAITYFNTAVESKPDFAEAYYNRGNAKVKLVKYQVKIFNPDSPESIQSGTSFAIYGLHLSAITDFDTTIRLKPDHVYAYYSRGLAKVDIGQYEGAITDFETALKLAEQAGDTQLKRIVMTYLNSLKTPDKILRVGDKLPLFTSNDVVSRVNTLWSGKRITGFQKNGWIELKNGTRYVCVSPEGCEVANFMIIKGTIEVYHSKSSK